MAELTRREWNRLALSGLVTSAIPGRMVFGAKKINSTVRGVPLGIQSYSFRDRSLDDAIAAMTAAGIGTCELWQGHVEPKNPSSAGGGKSAREALRQWRLTTPLDEFKKVRAKFDRAGIDLYAYNLSFRDDFTDAEIARGFEMAKALGVKALTASSNVNTAKRIDPFAKKYKMRVGMHNHSNNKPNEFCTPESFAEAMNGTSEYIAINLDIGHFSAAGYDPVDFLRRQHSRIVTLHVKDRKRNDGPNVPFGEGDTPIKEVLALLRDNKWSIPANLEYEYGGKDAIVEVQRCMAYCKQAIESK